jgi:hypothetical protein
VWPSPQAAAAAPKTKPWGTRVRERDRRGTWGNGTGETPREEIILEYTATNTIETKGDFYTKHSNSYTN